MNKWTIMSFIGTLLSIQYVHSIIHNIVFRLALINLNFVTIFFSIIRCHGQVSNLPPVNRRASLKAKLIKIFQRTTCSNKVKKLMSLVDRSVPSGKIIRLYRSLWWPTFHLIRQLHSYRLSWAHLPYPSSTCVEDITRLSLESPIYILFQLRIMEMWRDIVIKRIWGWKKNLQLMAVLKTLVQGQGINLLPLMENIGRCLPKLGMVSRVCLPNKFFFFLNGYLKKKSKGSWCFIYVILFTRCRRRIRICLSLTRFGFN